MTNQSEQIGKAQAAYYSDLLKHHGQGVDAVASGKQIYKDLRYERISKVLGDDSDATVHEIGCGLGHYYEFLTSRFPDKRITYSGSDVTPGFVSACRDKFPRSAFFLRDLATEPCEDSYDYIVLPGVFYHLAGTDEVAFFEYCKALLKQAFSMSRRGIAVNFITGFREYSREDLFYCDVGPLLTFVVQELSRFFVLDHAYPLYEFTLSVYTEDCIASRNMDDAFTRYFRSQVEKHENA